VRGRATPGTSLLLGATIGKDGNAIHARSLRNANVPHARRLMTDPSAAPGAAGFGAGVDNKSVQTRKLRLDLNGGQVRAGCWMSPADGDRRNGAGDVTRCDC
jgi:hypothetical protein